MTPIVVEPIDQDASVPSFATTEELAARAGRTFTDAEVLQAEGLLAAATAVISDAAGKTEAWAATLSPVPNMLRFLCIELANRVLANPDGLRSSSEQLGAYQNSRSFRDAAAGAGLLLSTVEELLVRRTVYGRTTGSAKTESIVNDIYPCCGS